MAQTTFDIPMSRSLWVTNKSRLSKPWATSQQTALLCGLWINFCFQVLILFEFLPSLPSVVDSEIELYAIMNSFLPKLLLIMVFCHNNRKQIEKVSQFHITVVNYFKGSVEREGKMLISHNLFWQKVCPTYLTSILNDLRHHYLFIYLLFILLLFKATIVLIFIKCILWLLHTFI